ncbi:flagellar filament capping protein FliD [Arcobacter sp. CECT 8985]|uniref:flagellar filament capping protein FliD n=1 Tax=Arcobacter sp. CECT 8985 TaxID=1935424 RepID=UPI00100C142F|nr:flagellar filament capping protein FliD [Arcobacter sp. CECT 8985]RXJ87688.1 flagellar hook protein FliD [Arcobacter sp. CECT 8985]
MAEGILGLGTGQSTGLSQELIDKLKAAERKGQVEPLETDLKNLGLEKEKLADIRTKFNALLDAIKPFDLFVSGGVNAFNQKAASTTGSSVVFDAPDVASLKEGVTTVDVTQLSQKDVFQSNTFTMEDLNSDTPLDAGDFTIEIGGETHTFDAPSYFGLVNRINDANIGVTASIEPTGPDSNRIVIKSDGAGTENAIKISGPASQVLGFTTDGTTENPASHTLVAKNMKATVDGVEYESSSNDITVDGVLKITAVTKGTSSINITKDTNAFVDLLDDFVAKYNDFTSSLNEELVDPQTNISDKSSLRNLLSGVKNRIMGEYGGTGEDDKKSLFMYGFQLDSKGKLSYDSGELQKAIDKDFDGLQELFIGKAESKGLGTNLKEYMDDATYDNGILHEYDDYLTDREKTLTEEKDKAVAKLDLKYSTLAQQFASYTAIITKMESSFSGLKQMIAQSTASN